MYDIKAIKEEASRHNRNRPKDTDSFGLGEWLEEWWTKKADEVIARDTKRKRKREFSRNVAKRDILLALYG